MRAQVGARNKETGAALRAHQIVGHVNSIMVAGHDTTSFMLASAVYYLARWVGCACNHL
jgi:cytochrome P450